mgnify:CR=1 FL=1
MVRRSHLLLRARVQNFPFRHGSGNRAGAEVSRHEARRALRQGTDPPPPQGHGADPRSRRAHRDSRLADPGR